MSDASALAAMSSFAGDATDAAGSFRTNDVCPSADAARSMFKSATAGEAIRNDDAVTQNGPPEEGDLLASVIEPASD